MKIKSLSFRLLNAILVFFLCLSSHVVLAERKSLRDCANPEHRDGVYEVISTNVNPISLNLNDYVNPDEIPFVVEDNPDNRETVPFSTKETEKTVTYKKAFNYNGEDVDITLTAKVTQGKARIFLVTDDRNYGKYRLIVGGQETGSSNRIMLTAHLTKNADGSELKYTGLYGIKDLDYGDYFFDVNKTLYFEDAVRNNGSGEAKFADGILKGEDGLYSKDREYKTGYNEGMVFVRLNEESTFEIELEFHNDYVAFPYLYELKYQFKYDKNEAYAGGSGNVSGVMENDPAVIGNNNLKENSFSANGYKFVGWNSVPDGSGESYDNIMELQSSEFGDELIVKTIYAQWEPIEYKLEYNPNDKYVNGNPKEHAVIGEMDPNPQVVIMGDNDLQVNKYESKGYEFTGWNTKEDGTGTPYKDKYEVTAAKIEDKDPEKPIDTLYAQWKPKEYKIIYKPNDIDLKASVKNPEVMEDDKFDLVSNPDPDEWKSDDHPWPYQIDGYTFVGYKVENTGDTINNPQDFKELLLNEEDQEVKLYAQWDPWKYYIHYDGNGADNMSAMGSQTFDYFDDETMMSKKNAFSRDGYRFDGFRVEVNGNVRIVWSPENFREVLEELGPGSSVTLKAMWEKLPVRFQAPVTGVE